MLKDSIIVDSLDKVSELVRLSQSSNIALVCIIAQSYGYVIYSPAGKVLAFTDYMGVLLSLPPTAPTPPEGKTMYTPFGWA
jgi:hypothetical protein